MEWNGSWTNTADNGALYVLIACASFSVNVS